ncbi:MAG: DUF3039 domain-containing protein [Acidimicrobiia bacterium]|nr:DUF3039 domain-containing protein [Acidimicrobiia bacterium]
MTNLSPVVAERSVDETTRLAHIGRKAEITRGYVEGTPVRALCGKVTVPTRDPERLPDCPECRRLFGMRLDRMLHPGGRPR